MACAVRPPGERECKAATLCLIHGYTRPEAADALGETPKRMEKVMDRVQRKLAVLTADIAGGDWCRSRRSMIKAYALALLDHGGERYTLATEHLAACAACRRYINSTRGLAAILPPVALPLGGAGTPALDRLNVLAAAAWRHGRELLGGHIVETGAATAGAGAALAHGGGAGHGGPGAIATKVAAVCAVSAVCAAGALAATGAFSRDAPPPAAARPSPTPAATVAATTPVPASAATAKPDKPKRAAKRKPKRARPRSTATPRPVSTPRPVVTPAPVVTRAPAPVATPRATIVTDAKQEFGK